MAMKREAILNLYRNLIREAKKWNSYNYREYTLRKVRDEFRENQALNNTESIKKCYNKGLEALEIVKRQVIIGNLYSTRPLVIETQRLKSDKTCVKNSC